MSLELETKTFFIDSAKKSRKQSMIIRIRTRADDVNILIIINVRFFFLQNGLSKL